MTSEEPPTGVTNDTWGHGDLFTWHGSELLFIPLMMTCGIVGNLFVFYIYHFRCKSNTISLFKRMLSVLDLCCLFLMWPSLLYIIVEPEAKNFMFTCIFLSYVALGTNNASSCVLVVIAVDRYMKLCLLRKTGIGSQLAKRLFVASCAFAIIVTIPVGWVFGRRTIDFEKYHVRLNYCFIDSSTTDSPVFIVWGVIQSLIFMAGTGTLHYLYSKIIMQLRQLSKKHDEMQRRPSMASTGETLKKAKQRQVMQTSAMVFIAVTVAFFASYAPYFVTLLLTMIDPSVEEGMSPASKAFYDLAKNFPILSNVANPFIYSFTSESFRAEIKKLITCKACQKDGFFRRRAFSIAGRSSEMSEEISQTIS